VLCLEGVARHLASSAGLAVQGGESSGGSAVRCLGGSTDPSWLDSGRPSRDDHLSARVSESERRSVQIVDFVRVYGVPSRLLTPKSGSGYSYLLYELSDGYKMLVYVPSVKASRFAAAQLFRENGEAEGPLLK
jgi:hypothetical protein